MFERKEDSEESSQEEKDDDCSKLPTQGNPMLFCPAQIK